MIPEGIGLCNFWHPISVRVRVHVGRAWGHRGCGRKLFLVFPGESRINKTGKMEWGRKTNPLIFYCRMQEGDFQFLGNSTFDSECCERKYSGKKERTFLSFAVSWALTGQVAKWADCTWPYIHTL